MLEGRIALITGGSRGIGEMIAKGFVRSGAKVYITARKAGPCKETAAQLSQDGEGIALPLAVSGAAGAAIFLASSAGDYVVSSTLPVDGGVSWTRLVTG